MKKIFLYLFLFFCFLFTSNANADYVNINTLPGYLFDTDDSYFIDRFINGNYENETFYFYYGGEYKIFENYNLGLYYDGATSGGIFYDGSKTRIGVLNNNFSGLWPTDIYIYVEPLVNGVCGSNSTTYDYDQDGYEGDFCSSGIADPINPNFPNQGEIVNWTCNGSGGGTNGNCSAYRTIKTSGSATGSLASSINSISTNTSTESNDILTGPTGILIGSLLGLIVVVLIIRRLYLIYKN